jgi:hypothetical protein
MGNVPYLVGVCWTPITDGPTIRWAHDSLQRLANSSQHSAPEPRDTPKPNLWAGSGPPLNTPDAPGIFPPNRHDESSLTDIVSEHERHNLSRRARSGARASAEEGRSERYNSPSF